MRRTMAMTSAGGSVAETAGWLAPIAWIGRTASDTLSYFGATALLMLEATASLVKGRPHEDDPSLLSTTTHELSWMLWAGFPLVALVHVAMGSFLSMQAYFGSTFVYGTGAVVGVGLLRNLASMMTGLTLAGMLPGRIVPELQRIRRRAAAEGREIAPGRLAAARMLAAVAAAPLLSLWGCVVGTVVGWKASEALMGLSTNMYFLMLVRMLWYRDVVGVLVKGMAFGLAIAALACAEGLRAADPESESPSDDDGRDPREVDPIAATLASIVRASCLAMAAILLLNTTWFLFVYHAVPVYGPSLLQPPTP